MSAGLSTGVIITILLCIITLLSESHMPHLQVNLMKSVKIFCQFQFLPIKRTKNDIFLQKNKNI